MLNKLLKRILRMRAKAGSSKRARQNYSRLSRIEALETRCMLSISGDFDVSGIVDQADISLWRANFGSTTAPAADGNHNGIVDAADYVIWRSNVGKSVVDSTDIHDHVTLQAGVLTIFGTNQDDVITVMPDRVTIDTLGVVDIDVNAASQLRVHALAGNDHVSIDPSLMVPAIIYGEDGNDTISGGSGDDIIYGGNGVDTLIEACAVIEPSVELAAYDVV